MSRPKALDLFCGAGGVSVGLERAGFDVTGVDIRPQPRYRGGRFVQADALTFPLDGYDFIWASPPCQAYSALSTLPGQRAHPRLVEPVRQRLRESGAAYVIENVPGAPLFDPLVLCGTEFGASVVTADGVRRHLKRHRLFESNLPLERYWRCACQGVPVGGVYGHGGGAQKAGRRGWQLSAADARKALGINWMTRDELAQAIPPIYAEWIGRQALAALERAA